MSDYGIKISRPGKDIKTETDIRNIIFTSGKNELGVRQVSNYTVTTDANGLVNTTFSHSFGYCPIFVALVTRYDGTIMYVPNQCETTWSKTEVLSETFKVAVSASQIRIRVYAYHYEPVQGGSSTNLSGQNYTFKVIYFFNEISNTA